MLDALHGTWLGHPLHPALTDVPVGAWTAALVLDAAELAGPGRGLGRAARTCTALGLVGAAASVATWLRRDKPAMPLELARLSIRISEAERNSQFLTLHEAEALSRVISLDPAVYVQLVDLYLAGPGADGEYDGLPAPRVCRACACSWSNSCPGSCAWSDADPTICTTCACIAVLGKVA